MTRHNNFFRKRKAPARTRASKKVLCSVIDKRTRACAQRDDQELRFRSPTWRRNGADWVLLAGHRCFGRVVADSKHPGMWRPTLSGGRLGDMANLAWAKNAVLAAAERELEWEARQRAATAPSKCPEKRGVFEGSAPPIAPNERGLPSAPTSPWSAS